MWTRIGAPHESLVSISLDRGDVGKDFMAEIDTRTCVGQVSGRMEARGSTRLARSLVVVVAEVRLRLSSIFLGLGSSFSIFPAV